MAFKDKLRVFQSRLLNIVFWSVVSAAFIGPGTITTATKAGAAYGFDLLWAIAFSTFACLLLQEASARITIYSGRDLGQAIAKQFEGKPSGVVVLVLVIGAIILGSAAYEAGNVLGSVEGLKMLFPSVPSWLLVSATGLLAFLALSLRSLAAISKFMGLLVMLMGIAFFFAIFSVDLDWPRLLEGMVVPRIPEFSPLTGDPGAGLLILALIGTTVVPYDIFLGSGVLEKKQTIKEMRFGLSIAIVLGGIISMAVLVVGTLVDAEVVRKVSGQEQVTEAVLSEHLYESLTLTLNDRLGIAGVAVLGFGMFAAGFSSAITAPLASALTAKSLFENRNRDRWDTRSRNYKLIWGGVLSFGLAFGFAGVQPVPAIIFAQALNGLILPFISIFLIFVINDISIMGKEGINGWSSNILMAVVVCVSLIMGLIKVRDAVAEVWEIVIEKGWMSLEMIAMTALLISLAILTRIYVVRSRKLKNLK